MTLLKNKKKAGCKSVVRHDLVSEYNKRMPSELNVSIAILHVKSDRHPFLHGIGSLGNISGGYVRFSSYMRGNYIHDMRSDWQRVGEQLRESLATIR